MRVRPDGVERLRDGVAGRLARVVAGLVVAGLGAGGVAGCSEATDEPPACNTSTDRRLVTADWLNRSLSVLDAGALADPSCGVEDALLLVIDLSDHPPGPLEVEMTVDGRAVVAVGPGFLAGTAVPQDDVPSGGGVLVVDTETGDVEHVIETPHAPMGLAISRDGRFALSANYGTADVAGNTLSLIDLETGALVSSVEVGRRPEQVALNDATTAGMVNAAADDLVRGLTTDGTSVGLGEAIDIGADPSDVAYIADNRAVATSSLGLSYSLIDTTDPTRPALLSTHGSNSGIPYGVTAIPGTREVLITTFFSEPTLVHVSFDGDDHQVLGEIGLTGSLLSLVAVHDPASGMVFVPQPTDRQLSIVDLDAETSRTIRWLDDVGPTYAAMRPTAEALP